MLRRPWSSQTVDAPARFSRFGKGDRDLHHEGLAEAAEDVAARLDVPGSSATS
jgi:hypothetical protein